MGGLSKSFFVLIRTIRGLDFFSHELHEWALITFFCFLST